ncbi:hypothetical protein [Streptomyces sp. NPDC059455]|uniref:hypothetical protein n=1 Tax=Streptomyces sp. NPDC059455 TaxID=3346837 RepID=UPI0036BC67DD
MIASTPASSRPTTVSISSVSVSRSSSRAWIIADIRSSRGRARRSAMSCSVQARRAPNRRIMSSGPTVLPGSSAVLVASNASRSEAGTPSRSQMDSTMICCA